ncbi:MAG: glycoside hydrolase family 127 protein, partial [Tannerella sp.]|nr:glycoside hydrolase family 127 protein [Tannerella sp.]
GDAKYIDILERSLYNGALAGISLAGDRFFYVNPLASSGDHHRQAWYGCACCPSQISRFLPSIGNYIYGVSTGALWVNLYIGNTAEFEINGKTVCLRQETAYPRDGAVRLTVESVSAPLKEAIHLRLPGWCASYAIAVNGETVASPHTDKGYAVLRREWKAGDRITLSLDMPVEIIAADPRVAANAGKRAIQRGPLVYCAEQADNRDAFDRIALSPETACQAVFQPALLGGVTTVTATDRDRSFTLIPYYAWDNREAGEMKVWIDYREE